jgi:hypothetical protein
MPLKVFCKSCGCVLLDLKRLREMCQFASMDSWYATLYGRLSGKCPKCSRKLPTPNKYAVNMGIEVSVAIDDEEVPAKGEVDKPWTRKWKKPWLKGDASGSGFV